MDEQQPRGETHAEPGKTAALPRRPRPAHPRPRTVRQNPNVPASDTTSLQEALPAPVREVPAERELCEPGNTAATDAENEALPQRQAHSLDLELILAEALAHGDAADGGIGAGDTVEPEKEEPGAVAQGTEEPTPEWTDAPELETVPLEAAWPQEGATQSFDLPVVPPLPSSPAARAAMAAAERAAQRVASQKLEQEGDVPPSLEAGQAPSQAEKPEQSAAQRLTVETRTLSPELSRRMQTLAQERKQSKDKRSGKMRAESILLEWTSVLFIALIIVLVLTQVVFVNTSVPSESMEDTIHPGDRLLGFRLAYVFGEPQRGDIVIFKYPDDEKQYYIKRIIGLPGETVEIRDGLLYLNGQAQDEGYVKDGMYGDFGPYYVPNDAYFVMGDNRNNSWDARYWQNTYVRREKIVGKAFIKLSPELEMLSPSK